MRFIRNDIQTPKKLVADNNRRSTAFLLMIISVIIFAIGATVFFGVFIVRDLIRTQFNLEYHDIQTYALFFAGAGMFLFIVSGIILKVSLRGMNYYKLRTIIRNEPFDPPRKGDFTKSIRLLLKDLNDDWALYSEIVPSDFKFKIPQVVIGPGGIFTFYPSNENPDRSNFKDPGKALEKASNALGQEITEQVIPFVLFQTSKLAEIYKKKHDPKTRVMYVLEMFDYLNDRKNKLNKEEQKKIEEKLFLLIKGTPPGKKIVV
jgi:hypothetical protein